MVGTTARRVRNDFIRLCQAGLDAQTLKRQALQKLNQAVPIDAFFCASADPATLLFTGSVLDGIAQSSTPAFLQNEFLQDDVNKFVSLTRGSRKVSTLARATEGRLEASPRYVDLLAPMRLGDELRAAIISGRNCWGFMCLHRDASGTSFSAAECAYVEQLLPHLAEGLRRALLLANATVSGREDGPGVLILAGDGSLVSATPAAERWLAEVAEADWPGTLELPSPVYARGPAASGGAGRPGRRRDAPYAAAHRLRPVAHAARIPLVRLGRADGNHHRAGRASSARAGDRASLCAVAP
ncbi:MAG TPA: LuxR family transcriptional regulator [Chloroflexota bacterium]|nr:LuxR family transcriptional regulator [Chloroflexota bacterium]